MLQRASFFNRRERVLDVGCGPGYLAEHLATRMECSVVGVEQDATLAAVARRTCAVVHERDLERDGLRGIPGKYSAIFFGDVIEHVRNAGQLLTQAAELLEPGGRVIVSTPNFVHVKNRIRVLFGSFEYRDAGLLDRTHVHFYTRKTLFQLLAQCGYGVTRVDYTTGVLDLGSAAHRLLYQCARMHPNLFAYQFIVAASPLQLASPLPEPQPGSGGQ